MYVYKSYRWANTILVDNRMVADGKQYIVMVLWWVGRKLMNYRSDFKFIDTSMYVAKRDFHGGFETLHFLIWVADVSKWTKIRNVIAYSVVWNIYHTTLINNGGALS